jgi:hypothetical protein
VRWSLSTGHWQLAARRCCAEFGSRFQTGLTGTCTWPRLCRRILALRSYGELPAPIQAKLLRFLQEKCFQRVGGRQEIQSDTRGLAATNRNRA